MITMPRPSKSEKWAIPAIIVGHLTTLKHFMRNILGRRGIPNKGIATIEYPDERRQYSDRFRGRHWLRTREDGSVACVACYMCSTNCPAQCIRIVASEDENLSQEKYPVVFEIDLLRCVYCGYCVDACPCNVIYMTRDDELATMTREESIITLKELTEEPKSERIKGDIMGYRPWYGERPVWKDDIDRMKY
ncbi:MAG TPA: NADH-quinone oxidoreductase subunit I [Thermoanaerobaculia bacterium]|nr:NADH-quinone oxidoreductase subunit I [Thermoanaerobaculia bacterium]HUM29823.1 NADH-quinone oxidoreductase subunit I [Thermoanaerobaculia bacterium]HXK68098.1 NADH-quinone oxidoreductase subunit I [Thermoanaerobaculia bacterium]